MTFWTDGLALMTRVLVGQLRGLASHQEMKIQPKHLKDTVKHLSFYHSHRNRLLILYSAVTYICLFHIDEEHHMALQKCP